MKRAWRDIAGAGGVSLACALLAACPQAPVESGSLPGATPGSPSVGPSGPAAPGAGISGQVFEVATAAPYAERPAAGVLVFLDRLGGGAVADASGDLRTTTDLAGRFTFRPIATGDAVVVGALLPGNRHLETIVTVAEPGTRSVALGPATALAFGFWRDRAGASAAFPAASAGVFAEIASRTRSALEAGSVRAPLLRAGAADEDHDRYLVDVAARDRALADLWAGLLGSRPLALGTFAGSWRQGDDGDGGPAASARLNRPAGIAFGPGGTAYLAEEGHHRIRQVAPDGTIRPFAGAFEGDASVEPFPQLSADGTDQSAAALPYPRSLAVDGAGNVIVALAAHQIALIATVGGAAYGLQTAPGKVYRIGGGATSEPPGRSPDAAKADGTVRGWETTLKAPGGMALDGQGNLYVAERLANRVLRIDWQTGLLTALPVALAGPVDLAWAGTPGEASGDLFVFEASANAIRRLRVVAGQVAESPVFAGSGVEGRGWNGDGPGAKTDLADPARYQIAPGGLAVDPVRRRLFFADTNNFRIRMVGLDDPSRMLRSVAGGDGDSRGKNFRDGEATRCAIVEPTRLAFDPAGNLVFSDRYQYVYRILYLASGM